jgi:hypothetical protein
MKHNKPHELVVAKYKEDLSWLNQIVATFPDTTVTVYDKSGTTPPTCWPGALPLPNVGRESHTYLTHVIENYDNLADFTTFLQGNPLDHCTMDNVRQLMLEKTRVFTPICYCYFPSNTKIGLNVGWETDDSGGTIADWWHKVFGTPFSGHTKACFFGQFTVSRECVLRRPIDFYKNAILTVNKSSNPEEGHFFERTWGDVFIN